MDITEVKWPARRRRGRYSNEFKREIVKACQAPGVSTASVALANGIHANLLRRWVLESGHQDRSAGVRGLPLRDRTVQAQPQGASKALPPRSQRESDRVASGAFWRRTQDQRSLLAQELSTRPLQSLLYIYFSSLGRGGAQ
jgi:transposase-like protein